MLLRCKNCEREKSVSDFSAHPNCLSGYDTSKCKACKKAAWDWKMQPLEKRILNRTRERAKKKGRDFNLTIEDIILPEVCPVFKKPFIYGHLDWTYSIDRIDNSKGYIRGNIIIVSNKANRLKNDASADELQTIVNFYRGCEIDEELFKI